jgi:hypothetical protein
MDLSKIDGTLLADAAQVLHPDAQRETAAFYATALSVLDRLNSAARPATACGVRFTRSAMRDRKSRERRALMRAGLHALVALIGVFTIYGYIAYGQTIVRAIDAWRPQIDQVQDQLRTLIAASDPPGRGTAANRAPPTAPPPPSDAPTADSPPPPPQPAPAEEGDMCSRTGAEKGVGAAWVRECARLVETAQNLSSQFNAAHDRLHDWRDVLLSQLVFFNFARRTDVVCFDEVSRLDQYPRLPQGERAHLADVIAVDEGRGFLLRSPQCLGGRDGSYAGAADLNTQAYSFRQRHEQQARSIIDTVSLFVLPGLFGLLGAMLAHVRELHQAMSEHRVDPAMFARSGLQLLLGTVLGALTGVLFSTTFLTANFGLDRIAVAFFAGFSVESAFRFIQGLLDRALRSASDDRRDARRDAPPPARDPQEPQDRPPGEGERPRAIAAVRG